MKFNCYFLMMLSVIFLSSCTKKNKSTSVEPRDFTNAYSFAALYEPSINAVTVQITLQPGFHAYAPGEQIGKAVNLIVKDENGWKAQGEPSIPHGQMKKLPGLGESHILNGTFSLSQKVTRGTLPGKVIVSLQICTDTQCDRPRTHELLFN